MSYTEACGFESCCGHQFMERWQKWLLQRPAKAYTVQTVSGFESPSLRQFVIRKLRAAYNLRV